jgi:EAL domain-containing protein (putative c-di-GMP-specific phosphodiesterase class I)
VQPIVEVNGRAVMGYEFLFRGLRDDGTMVPPMEMFTAAREPNLSARLDAAARDCAVRTAARFGIPEKLFINVLPTSVSLGQSAFTDTLDLIEAAQIPPSQVVFEIVESEAVADISLLSRMINFCRNAGYSIALDDFGSGFNNLTMLIGLNPDYIKLDKSLISRISDEPPIWNLVANMIDAAKQSNVKVIAEGVEDERTARLLSALGADYMQGYLLGRPEDRPKLLD